MKKLGKLSLNEMQGYAPVHAEEQKAMKGGTITPAQWVPYIVGAWKMAKDIMEMINGSGSGSSSQGSNLNVEVYGLDSAKVVGSNIYIYGLDSVKVSVSR